MTNFLVIALLIRKLVDSDAVLESADHDFCTAIHQVQRPQWPTPLAKSAVACAVPSALAQKRGQVEKSAEDSGRYSGSI